MAERRTTNGNNEGEEDETRRCMSVVCCGVEVDQGANWAPPGEVPDKTVSLLPAPI